MAYVIALIMFVVPLTAYADDQAVDAVVDAISDATGITAAIDGITSALGLDDDSDD